MRASQVSMDFSPCPRENQHPNSATGSDGHVARRVEGLLDRFDGEPSLKRLFWELLSYDRVREPLPLSLLPHSLRDLMLSFEVFAASEALTVVYAVLQDLPEAGRVEQMAWALKRHIPNCIVLLHDRSKWLLVYPDESTRPRVRVQPLPGPPHQRLETARALAALSATDTRSDEVLSTLELTENLDTFFPGAMPRLSELFGDVDQMLQYVNAEVRHTLHFIKDAAKYPLLTAPQERGEDIHKDAMPPDGSNLSFQQWRLVVHNLRLVLWMARRVPRMGMELGDLVQEGAIGLMTAARKFDPGLGFRFTTYAFYWVRQAMFRGLHNNCSLIRWPVWKAPELISAHLRGEDEGLAPGERVVELVPWRLSFASLQLEHPIRRVARQERRWAVQRALGKLKPRERDVIERRFGIGFDREYTLEEIGKEFDLTRERVRQIEDDALKKLRRGALRVLKPHTPAPPTQSRRSGRSGNRWGLTLTRRRESAGRC